MPKAAVQSRKTDRVAAVAISRTEKPRKAPPRPPQISDEDRIRQMVSDRKILLRTHVGTIMPIVFNGNGEMTGHAGSLAFFLGSSRDKGRWWVAKGKLCHKWRVWLDRETLCMKLKEQGDTIWWQADDGKRGTARIVSK